MKPEWQSIFSSHFWKTKLLRLNLAIPSIWQHSHLIFQQWLVSLENICFYNMKKCSVENQTLFVNPAFISPTPIFPFSFQKTKIHFWFPGILKHLHCGLRATIILKNLWLKCLLELEANWSPRILSKQGLPYRRDPPPLLPSYYSEVQERMWW